MSNNEPDYSDNLLFLPQEDKLAEVKDEVNRLKNLADKYLDNNTKLSPETVWSACSKILTMLETI